MVWVSFPLVERRRILSSFWLDRDLHCVIEIAGQLSETGAIEYRGGTIHILDDIRLELESCLCHSIVRDQDDRLNSIRPPELRGPTLEAYAVY